MELRLKIKPRRVTAPTKELLMERIVGGRPFVYSSLGNYFKNSGGKIRLFTIEKHNRKVVQTKIEGNKTVSTLVSPKQWIANLYDVSSDVLDAMRIEVYQGTRTFEIVSK